MCVPLWEHFLCCPDYSQFVFPRVVGVKEDELVCVCG